MAGEIHQSCFSSKFEVRGDRIRSHRLLALTVEVAPERSVLGAITHTTESIAFCDEAIYSICYRDPIHSWFGGPNAFESVDAVVIRLEFVGLRQSRQTRTLD